MDRVNAADIEKIVDLFRDKKPHVIAVASESRRALDIKMALTSMTRHLHSAMGIMLVSGRFFTMHFTVLIFPVDSFSKIPPKERGGRDTPVEIVDSLLSILYQNSETGRLEFPSHPPLLRQAISVARRLLDPLLSFSQLYNMDDDILNLNFHPLQVWAGNFHLPFFCRRNRLNLLSISRCVIFAVFVSIIVIDFSKISFE